MKKFFTLVVMSVLALSANAQRISWTEDDAASAGTLDGKEFVNGDFKLIITDTDGKVAIDKNNAYFGTADANEKFTARLKSGGKSSSKNSITLTVPAAGTLKVYARTGSNSATDRTLVLTQGETELYNKVVQEDDAAKVKGMDSNDPDKETNVYPVISVEVAAGEVAVSYPVGSMNFYGFEFVAGDGGGVSPDATIEEIAISNFTPWDNCTIEGNTINMSSGYKGGSIYIGRDMTQYDYVWIKFSNATGNPNFGITYDEWQKNESWGPVFASSAIAMDGSGMVGIKLDKKSVMVKGNAETDGVGIGDVYAQHVQQITIQGQAGAASVTVEGIWFGTVEEYVAAGGDVPLRPAPGGALTMWEGNHVYNGWSVTDVVDTKYFEVAKVGDVIYCTIVDANEPNPVFKNVSDWSDFKDLEATKVVAADHFECTISTEEALQNLQKNGLRLQGINFTLTKIELINKADAAGINSVKAGEVNDALYNLAGQKVDANYKGVVIKSGKKMIQK